MSQRLVLPQPFGRLQLEPYDPPLPGPSQIQVKVLATSLNHLDWKKIRKNLFIPSFPHVLGMDIVGQVVDPGDSRKFEKGDLVLGPGTVGYSDGCSYQTHALVNENFCSKGANGGVGKLAVQLAKISGYSVIALTSNNETTAQANARGADYSFSNSDPNLITKIKSVAPDLSLAFDTVVTQDTMSKIAESCSKPATVATAIKYLGSPFDGVQINFVYSGEILGKTMSGQPVRTMMPHIKQIAAGRRKPNMTRKEFFDHRFRIHGSISDGIEDKDQKPLYVDSPMARTSELKYVQTQVFDSAFGSRPGGPLNANQNWVGRDDTTELFFHDWGHVLQCFSSDYVKTTIAPDGPFFADFETSIILMAYEKAIPLQTAAAVKRAGEGKDGLDTGDATVAMYFISTPDDMKDGKNLEQVITPRLVESVNTHCQDQVWGIICNIGAVSDQFDLNTYFGGANMPQYALVYKIFLSGPEAVPQVRKAQTEFQKYVGEQSIIDLHKSFILFSQEALVMDVEKGIRFSRDRQPVFTDLPGPSHLD
ncbi:hypothetical protein FBEOM_10948 [Fusarium beomiforme]|uniref:Enoyl reductase (ER) domain-containing protein n=1 Tax=Fusarium beomiforme TaxID=44412 RepID=A0A9P5DUF8_9HYPO|nr:hypothetical protein FBEOM_10948 [Fusarium beomiforme]